MGRLAVKSGARVQRFVRKLGNIAYSSGSTPGLPGGVIKSDYLTALEITSNQTITTGGSSPVIAGYGAYGALGLVSVKIGAKAPFSLPAYHANVYEQIFDNDYVDSLAASAVTINSTLNWKNHLHIPLTVDPESELAAWYIGDQSLPMDVRLTCAPASTVFSTVNAATIGGSWDVWGEIFSAPAPDQPGGWLKEISYYKETTVYTTQQLKNGVTNIPLDIDKDYLQIICIFYTGSAQDSTFAPADGLYTIADLAISDTVHIFDTVDEQTYRFRQLQAYERLLPAGTLVFDFMTKLFSRRDVLPADANDVRSLNLKITSTSVNNFVDIITVSSQDSPHAAKWAALYAANPANRAA